MVVAYGWSMSLTCLTFVYLSCATAPSLLTVNICVFVEQFGYGFGFTAYMLYLIYFSEGKHKTAHYAICTGFMARHDAARYGSRLVAGNYRLPPLLYLDNDLLRRHHRSVRIPQD